jgi:hypothetical protein
VRRRGDASFVAISATTVALVGGNLRIRPMRKKELHGVLNKFFCFVFAVYVFNETLCLV